MKPSKGQPETVLEWLQKPSRGDKSVGIRQRVFPVVLRGLERSECPMPNPTPFRIEQYYAKYEFNARFMLSSSDCESRSVSELLTLEPDARERLEGLWLGYTETWGAPNLRATIAGVYQTLEPANTLVVAAAEEGIFLAYHALLQPGDHVIVEAPCYESAVTLAIGAGATVSKWQRHFENGWAHDLEALAGLVRPNTRLLYINSPHNPTGTQMTPEIFNRIVEIARDAGAYLFSDEVYRELEHDSALRLPAACDLYERAISLGSISKSYGLPGLRLGWLASKDSAALEACLQLKLYTTICCSAPSEFLVDLALRHRQTLTARNLEIVHDNLPLLDAFFARHTDLFSWVRPNASPIGFPRVQVPDAMVFCERILSETSVLLLPGTVYDEPQHLRVGFGRKNMPEALLRLEEALTGVYT
jgi:aspartate/methionine/tyrosine aminotransferase